VDLSEDGGFKIDSTTMATNIEGIFAAGDAVKMPGTIVGAIAAGHAVAKTISSYLGHDISDDESEAAKGIYQMEEDVTPGFLQERDRWDLPSLTPKDAVRTFSESQLGYPVWQAIEEAKRCLNCRMCGNCLFGRGQLCLETSRRLLASM
jgi:succinate dehydrogenase/fumarate reductase flavoprotein subunit